MSAAAGWSATAEAYQGAAWEMDEHQRLCPSCGSGGSCADGDALAEAEYRSFGDFHSAAPDAAGQGDRYRPGLDPITSNRWETTS